MLNWGRASHDAYKRRLNFHLGGQSTEKYLNFILVTEYIGYIATLNFYGK